MNPDPTESVNRAKRGDKAAFEQLIALHGSDLLRFLLRLTGRREDALDVFQDTLLSAFSSISSLRDPDSFRGWIAMIATNVFRKRARRDARTRAFELPRELADPATTEVGAIFQSLAAEDRSRLVRLAIGELPERQRAVISLRLDLGLPFQRIGVTLGITEENARANHYQGLKALRKRLPQFSTRLGDDR